MATLKPIPGGPPGSFEVDVPAGTRPFKNPDKDAQIESLRAECGLRQIQGYNEGWNAAIEAAANAVRGDGPKHAIRMLRKP